MKSFQRKKKHFYFNFYRKIVLNQKYHWNLRVKLNSESSIVLSQESGEGEGEGGGYFFPL